MTTCDDLGPPPRFVRLTPAGRSSRAFSQGLLLAVLLIGAVAGCFRVRAESRLAEGGAVATVRIDDATVPRGRSQTQTIRYVLDVPGFRGRFAEDVSGGGWAAGTTTTITYLPDQPRVHEVGTIREWNVRYAIYQSVATTVVACVVPFVGFAASASQIRREAGLLARGVCVLGRVVENVVPPGSRSGQHRVVVECPTPGGARRCAFSAKGSGGERLAAGAALPCLYLPDETFEAIPVDELKMVESA